MAIDLPDRDSDRSRHSFNAITAAIDPVVARAKTQARDSWANKRIAQAIGIETATAIGNGL
jgi:hypothetical protein